MNTSSTQKTRSPIRIPMSGSLGVSLIAVILILGFAFMALATTLTSVFAGGTDGAKTAEKIGELVAMHQEKMQEYQERFNGRSVFFKPPAPPPPPTPKKETPKIEPPPPPESKISDKYGGPSIIFALGDLVRFKGADASGKQLEIRVGEEKSGVKVISTEKLPWSVRVGHKGGEYDVEVFKRGGDPWLLAKAPAMEIVPGLITVPAPKSEIETPKADGPIVEAGAANKDESETSIAVKRNRAVSTREERGSQPTGQQRPQAKPAAPAQAETRIEKEAETKEESIGEETDDADTDTEVEDEDEDVPQTQPEVSGGEKPANPTVENARQSAPAPSQLS